MATPVSTTVGTRYSRARVAICPVAEPTSVSMPLALRMIREYLGEV